VIKQWAIFKTLLMDVKNVEALNKKYRDLSTYSLGLDINMVPKDYAMYNFLLCIARLVDIIE
jgi:hypothetical protein